MRAIFNCDSKWGIGKKNDLLFSLPLDMKFFRETTKGKTVVMGYNTLRSFPGGKPLRNRVNIVLCPEDAGEGVVTVHNFDELFEELANYPPDEVFVVGGASVYAALIPYCTEVFVTRVEADGGAEVFVPDLDKHPEFELISQSEPVEDNGYTLRFCTYRNLAVRLWKMDERPQDVRKEEV